MASKYASAFDDLLASGRQQLDQMTGRPPPSSAAPPLARAAAVEPEPPAEGTVVEGIARGVPFRLRVR